MAFPTVSLSDYLTQTADLLHVSSANSYGYWGEAKLTRFINRGMQRRDLLTGGVRTLVNVTLTVGQEAYVFTNTVGLENAFDINAITLVMGNARYPLGQLPFTELTRNFRQYTTMQSYPVAWAKLNAFTVYVAPLPSQAYVTTWDVSSYSTPLAVAADTDDLPYPYTEPVPYWAARLAKMDERQYEEAASFEEDFGRLIDDAINMKTGMVPNYYRMMPR